MKRLAVFFLSLLIVLVAGSANADIMTSYDVTYYLSGDVSQATKFYGDGAYDFLLGPGYVPVYLHDHNWIFIGMYGASALGYPQATLPASMPAISFPYGTDGAVAVPITSSSGSSGVVSVPELAILRSFTRRLGGQKFNDFVNPTLQRVTAWGAARLLGARNEGIYVVLPTKTLEVQQWCSGVASMKWLMVLALALGLMTRVRFSWAVGLIVIASVIALEVNILRVAGIGAGFAKDSTGWVTMASGVAQVVGLGLALPWLSSARRRHKLIRGLGKEGA